MQATQLAQQAWDQTKSKEDPAYADERMQMDFRGKLNTVAKDVLDHGTPGNVSGLEAFDAKCLELVKAERDKDSKVKEAKK